MSYSVFLDTSALKFASAALPRMQPRSQSIRWGDKEFDVIVHDFVTINPNERISNEQLKAEVNLLADLANLGKDGTVDFVIQVETELESWGLPKMDSETGIFFGAPITRIDAPIEYGRTMFAAGSNSRDMQYAFLAGLDHPRFREIQKITGAYQGKNPPNRNQLLDAWHLWCAEGHGCNFFLSLDQKLGDAISRSKHPLSVEFVLPSELIGRVCSDSE